MILLKAIGKADVHGDRPGVVVAVLKKARWLEPAKIECNDDVRRGSPTNLDLLLIVGFTAPPISCHCHWANLHSFSDKAIGVHKHLREPNMALAPHRALSLRSRLQIVTRGSPHCDTWR